MDGYPFVVLSTTSFFSVSFKESQLPVLVPSGIYMREVARCASARGVFQELGLVA